MCSLHLSYFQHHCSDVWAEQIFYLCNQFKRDLSRILGMLCVPITCITYTKPYQHQQTQSGYTANRTPYYLATLSIWHLVFDLFVSVFFFSFIWLSIVRYFSLSLIECNQQSPNSDILWQYQSYIQLIVSCHILFKFNPIQFAKSIGLNEFASINLLDVYGQITAAERIKEDLWQQ